MAEMWLDNPVRRTAKRRVRPRVTVTGDTVTFGKKSPYKGRVRKANAPGGVLMLVNRKSRRRKRSQPAALKAYWAGRRRRNPLALANPRRRRSVRRRNNPLALANPRRRRSYRRNPVRSRSFMPNMSSMTAYAMTAFGMVAPSLVSDRLLPMLGITLTGWLRRGVQLAVPVGVQYFAPRILGKDTPAFVAGAYGVTILGCVNDLVGFPGMVGRFGGYEAGRRKIAGYERGRSAGAMSPRGMSVAAF
jgi:hypothetical protein